MPQLKTTWKFWKAGQGCFYTGLLKPKRGAGFSFVYDCGSTKGAAILRDEIDDFKDELKKNYKNTLDLMIISHLDADHVNQVHHLLQGLDSCEKVIIPYLPIQERLFVYAMNGYNDGTDDDLYTSFITNPAKFLIDRGVKQVIFISGNDEQGLGSRENTVSPSPGSERKITRLVLNSLPDNIAIKNLTEEQEKLRTTDRKKVLFQKGAKEFFVGRYWQFYLYNIQPDADALNKFHEKLTTEFGLTAHTGWLSLADATRILADRKKRRKLKELFVYLFEDCNSTGLTVLHGPIYRNGETIFSSAPFIWPLEGKTFTLLNGDIDLKTINYPGYIISKFRHTKYFQVPHHGSDNNWKVEVIDSIGDAWMIVNSKHGNEKHPGKLVLKEINDNYRKWIIKHNTEYVPVEYHIDIYK